MNSLKKGEGVPLLNFEEGAGVLLLNFEGGPGVPLLNFIGVPCPTFKLRRGTRGPGPTLTPCRDYKATFSLKRVFASYLFFQLKENVRNF